MRENKTVRRWRAAALPAMAVTLTVALACAGCAGRYGSIRADARVAQELSAAQVLPGHQYYTTGSEVEPAAIAALREGRPLRGSWREITATPELLRKLSSEMQGTRLAPPDGGIILDDRGERIGIWFSYHPLPPPPKILDDGSVELTTPFVPSDGGGHRPDLTR